MSPAGTLCFDIFSPPSGDSDVISQVERLSSNEINIAPRSLRIAFGASGRSATVCMVVSRVGDRNLTLPERRSLSTSPWDLEAEIVALHHQLNAAKNIAEAAPLSIARSRGDAPCPRRSGAPTTPNQKSDPWWSISSPDKRTAGAYSFEPPGSRQ